VIHHFPQHGAGRKQFGLRRDSCLSSSGR